MTLRAFFGRYVCANRVGYESVTLLTADVSAIRGNEICLRKRTEIGVVRTIRAGDRTGELSYCAVDFLCLYGLGHEAICRCALPNKDNAKSDNKYKRGQ